MTKFEELGISSETLRSLKRMGFEEATPIQSETIPMGLAKKDLIGQAQTGTGKTTAFGVPMIDQIDYKQNSRDYHCSNKRVGYSSIRGTLQNRERKKSESASNLWRTGY